MPRKFSGAGQIRCGAQASTSCSSERSAIHYNEAALRHVMSTYASPFWAIGGLVAGIGLGILASTSGSPPLLAVVRFVEPAGTIFVNAIRMAVIPLVVASLIAGIVSIGDERSLTRLGVRSLVVSSASRCLPRCVPRSWPHRFLRVSTSMRRWPKD